jgi:outer membrane lipoprotein-sorting protein
MNRASAVLLFAIAIAAGILFLKTPLIGAQPPTAAQAGEQKTAEQVFKNIQVLKGVPADQVQPAMQFISNALGVECEFCHVQNAFDKDDKKTKQTARQMIEMQMAINKANFKGHPEVTCFTCHHGSHDPVSIPVIAEEEPKRPETQPAEAAAQNLPTADQIFDKYIQAVGGADALEQVKTRVQKGSINLGQRQLPVEIDSKAPNKRISFVRTPNGDNITAFDGNSGWLGSPGGRPPRDMTAAESEAASFDATFYLPVELKKMFAQTRVRPSDKIAGHDAVQVIGIKEGQPPVRLFFDKDSGLLLRTVRYTETPLGRNPTEVDYADYRSEGGVKIPFQWTVARPLGRFTINVSEVQQNVPVDDKKFEKPAAPPAPAKPAGQ